MTMRLDYPLATPRLIRPLQWSREEDAEHGEVVRLWSRRHEKWSVQRAWTAAVHEGVEAGADLDDIVRRVQDTAGGDAQRLRREVGTYLFALWDEGYLDLGFGGLPAPFRDDLVPVQELGRGAVGVVWRARDETRGTDVVVKHAWDFFQPLARADQRVRHEAEVLAGLVHPAVPRRLDAFDHDGLLHLERELVAGVPLAEAALAGNGLRGVARQLVELLAYLHAQGLLLMDLRPGNFRHDEGRVLCIDLGAAVPVAPGGALVAGAAGAPGFLAPEVRAGRAWPASDVYALGRLLFALHAGRPPLASWDGSALAARATPPWDGLVADCTATDPDARPTLDALRERLAEN